VTPAATVALRIERLVIETDEPIDGFTLQVALGEAIHQVVTERGLPSSWRHDRAAQLAVVDGVDWNGHGAEPGLAWALAQRLFDGAVS